MDGVVIKKIKEKNGIKGEEKMQWNFHFDLMKFLFVSLFVRLRREIRVTSQTQQKSVIIDNITLECMKKSFILKTSSNKFFNNEPQHQHDINLLTKYQFFPSSSSFFESREMTEKNEWMSDKREKEQNTIF